MSPSVCTIFHIITKFNVHTSHDCRYFIIFRYFIIIIMHFGFKPESSILIRFPFPVQSDSISRTQITSRLSSTIVHYSSSTIVNFSANIGVHWNITSICYNHTHLTIRVFLSYHWIYSSFRQCNIVGYVCVYRNLFFIIIFFFIVAYFSFHLNFIFIIFIIRRIPFKFYECTFSSI